MNVYCFSTPQKNFQFKYSNDMFFKRKTFLVFVFICINYIVFVFLKSNDSKKQNLIYFINDPNQSSINDNDNSFSNCSCCDSRKNIQYDNGVSSGSYSIAVIPLLGGKIKISGDIDGIKLKKFDLIDNCDRDWYYPMSGAYNSFPFWGYRNDNKNYSYENYKEDILFLMQHNSIKNLNFGDCDYIFISPYGLNIDNNVLSELMKYQTIKRKLVSSKLI